MSFSKTSLISKINLNVNVCLLPWHHVLLDYGILCIGSWGFLESKKLHSVNIEFLIAVVDSNIEYLVNLNTALPFMSE